MSLSARGGGVGGGGALRWTQLHAGSGVSGSEEPAARFGHSASCVARGASSWDAELVVVLGGTADGKLRDDVVVLQVDEEGGGGRWSRPTTMEGPVALNEMEETKMNTEDEQQQEEVTVKEDEVVDGDATSAQEKEKINGDDASRTKLDENEQRDSSPAAMQEPAAVVSDEKDAMQQQQQQQQQKQQQ